MLDRELLLPGLRREQAFAASLAISFHFVDYVTHGWDVARALGLAFEPAADITDAALHIAQRMPDDESRNCPGAASPARSPAVSTASACNMADQALGPCGECQPGVALAAR